MSHKNARTDKLKRAIGKEDNSNKHITKISATPSQHPITKPTDTTTVAKISAKPSKKPSRTDKKAKKIAKQQKLAKVSQAKTNPDEKPLKEVFILARPFVALGRYTRDSWRELRQVRWPNRKATWKMTLAVLIYCAILMAFILLLDTLFTFLFNLILSK